MVALRAVPEHGRGGLPVLRAVAVPVRYGGTGMTPPTCPDCHDTGSIPYEGEPGDAWTSPCPTCRPEPIAAAILQAHVAAWLEEQGRPSSQAAVARLLDLTRQEWGRYLSTDGSSPSESTIRGWLEALERAGCPRLDLTITPRGTR